MDPIKRILLSTDFSECSVQATQHAFYLAAQLGAELHMLHVIEDLRAVVPDYHYGAVEWPKELFEQMQSRAQSSLKELVAAQGEAQQQYPVLAVRQGRPFEQIVEYAEQHHVDLIVIGSHGRTGLGRLLMGSVAERVVRHASCPVLVVHPAVIESEHDGGVK